tara:strand:- start:66 stop:506 length:441 start_codon:yes stop_codon:yes gene_type:complete
MGIDPDFPENIIRLTRLEHGQAHYERWLKHKDPRDLGAAQLIVRGEIDGVDLSGKNNPRYGKKHSPESIQKMSEAHKGKKASLETKKKMSEAAEGNTNGLANRGQVPWNKGLKGVQDYSFWGGIDRKIDPNVRRNSKGQFIKKENK